jgi:hypothetical protein
VGSLAGYIGEAMDKPPICHALDMAKKSFDVPTMFIYLATDANKDKVDGRGRPLS